MKYRDRRQQVAGMALISMFSQVGCVTVIIVAVALVLGLWLDSTFDTGPLFTVVVLLVSVPVNVFLLVQIARSTAERLSVLPDAPQDAPSDEE
jgi:F0F1-type ATP synthase assembly protein I